jgi:hypothetical protein
MFAFIWISERTEIISLNNNKHLILVSVMRCVFFEISNKRLGLYIMNTSFSFQGLYFPPGQKSGYIYIYDIAYKGKTASQHSYGRAGGRECIAPTHDLGNRWEWVVSVMLRQLCTPGEMTPLPIVQKAGLAPDLDTEERGKILSPLPGIEPRSDGRSVWATRVRILYNPTTNIHFTSHVPVSATTEFEMRYCSSGTQKSQRARYVLFQIHSVHKIEKERRWVGDYTCKECSKLVSCISLSALWWERLYCTMGT